jgi:hypothetical protein
MPFWRFINENWITQTQTIKAGQKLQQFCSARFLDVQRAGCVCFWNRAADEKAFEFSGEMCSNSFAA